MTRTKRPRKRANTRADIDIEKTRRALLAWYDRSRRVMPWRALPEQTADPYHVWLSEIMLQQTTVGAVRNYFLKFIDRWPDVRALAAAPQEDILREWAGLGYYARARNLHACAQIVANDLNGNFPNDQAALKKLPGIGDYTSAAITAIAFNKPATVVDGNVERVMARLFAVKDPLPKVKPALKELATQYFENYADRPGDLAQAFMDLGAGICIPKNPRCGLCPLSGDCMAYREDIAAELPRKVKTAAKPQKFGYVYWIENDRGQVLLHRRPEKGLLGGMVGFPTSEWVEKTSQKNLIHAFSTNKDDKKKASIHHSFTHFDLQLDIFKTNSLAVMDKSYFWQNSSDLHSAGLPTLFKKVLNMMTTQSRNTPMLSPRKRGS